MRTLAHTAALVVVTAVAAYDLAVGLYMLASPTPWMAHGDTVWTALAAAPPEIVPAIDAALRRIGAFSTFAGLLGLYVAATHRTPTDAARLRGFMTLYLVAGLGFGWTDTAFAGTPYHAVKTAIGVVWLAATLALWRR